MNIVFFGTPQFAVPSLRALLAGAHRVVGVVSRPDRPAGRGQRLQSPPVVELARSSGIPVVQPEKIRTTDFREQLEAWAPELAIVAAYGRILPAAILDLPPRGCLNVHASLLPKYRGAAPIQWSILYGDSVTGVTIMQMNERMDEGDILLQHETVISAEESYGELEGRLAELGATALMETLTLLESGQLHPQPQEDDAATLAPMIKKEDGRIDWNAPAVEIVRRVRAFNPWPSAHTMFAGKLLKIHRARTHAARPTDTVGTVVGIGDSIDVAAGTGIVAITELQLAGRKRLTARDFARGGDLVVGARLES